ncbi:cysteine hydrolase family protein [Pusillimonas sp. NJUB218]|uniref:cysteine hydrolase family protein n=1 Tax=Pusillimonas sp. NJUB218 TaxID=2023230 RepID=UPI000F4C743D|nr:cysteine hydrolase [Pusillimonas sp. NJUB218]ROT46494.1 isochorismatase [Pusillimonas sp. NJUB218]
MNERTAVLALHYQNEVLHPDGKIRVGVNDEKVRERVINGATRLLAFAREQQLPVVHVRIAFRPDYADCPRNTPIFQKTIELGAVKDGEWGAEFMAPLQPLNNAREFVVTHQRISSFAGTCLDNILRMLDVQHLIVGGVATHSVVEHTVRDATDRGYEVTIAADACAAGSPEFHDAALRSLAFVAKVSSVTELSEGAA